jgi:hypothetical protein
VPPHSLEDVLKPWIGKPAALSDIRNALDLASRVLERSSKEKLDIIMTIDPRDSAIGTALPGQPLTARRCSFVDAHGV